MTYDEAVTALYQAPVEGFVAERKRLATELKTAGDKSGATKLAKLGRPTLSAWAVNQLWWHARDAFDKLFESAEQIRSGELAAQAPHREAVATLRGRASRMLTDGGHNANEGTLRRVTTTISALAASGGWSPDAPGSIAEDREPIGFDVALALANVPVRSTPTSHAKPTARPEPESDAEVSEEDEDDEDEQIDDEEEHTRREAAQRALESKHPEPAKPEPVKHHALKSVPKSEPAHDHEADKKKKEHDEAKRRAHEEAEKKKAEDKARVAKAAERSKLIANLATAQSELQRRHKVVTQLAEQLGIAEQQVAEAEDIVAALQAKLEEHA